MRNKLINAGVCALAFMLGAWGLSESTRADLIVTLRPMDENGRELEGPIPAGSTVEVDILLSVEDGDEPISDLRALQFDFAATSDSIEFGTFSWRVDRDAYRLRTEALPTPSTSSLISATSADLLEIGESPFRVATLEVTVMDDGVLNAIGPTASDRTSDALFTSGFDSPITFSLFDSNLDGESFEFETTAGSVDSDGDGVPDSEDDFDDDPDETTDTDDDEIGNNADTDDDGDGVDDDDDDFPLDRNETTDSDDDGVGDNADDFDDDPDETTDTDDDGIGDNADSDDDNDGFDDDDDAFPLDPTESRDSDGDGIGDNEEMNSNTGPRATGGVCGGLSLTVLSLTLLGLLALSTVCGSSSARPDATGLG